VSTRKGDGAWMLCDDKVRVVYVNVRTYAFCVTKKAEHVCMYVCMYVWKTNGAHVRVCPCACMWERMEGVCYICMDRRYTWMLCDKNIGQVHVHVKKTIYMDVV
jgi:hypothetical protein